MQIPTYLSPIFPIIPPIKEGPPNISSIRISPFFKNPSSTAWRSSWFLAPSALAVVTAPMPSLHLEGSYDIVHLGQLTIVNHSANEINYDIWYIMFFHYTFDRNPFLYPDGMVGLDWYSDRGHPYWPEPGPCITREIWWCRNQITDINNIVRTLSGTRNNVTKVLSRKLDDPTPFSKTPLMIINLL